MYEAYVVDKFCLNFIKAFEQEFYEDGGMLIRLVVSLFSFSAPTPGSHLLTIPIGRELLRKGPRNPHFKKAHLCLLQRVHRLVFVKHQQKVFKLLGGQEILSSHELLYETLPYKTDKVTFY